MKKWLSSYSPRQPDNQEYESNNEQDPEDRTCYEVKKQTQQPQDQDDNANDHEQVEHIAPFYLLVPTAFRMA